MYKYLIYVFIFNVIFIKQSKFYQFLNLMIISYIIYEAVEYILFLKS